MARVVSAGDSGSLVEALVKGGALRLADFEEDRAEPRASGAAIDLVLREQGRATASSETRAPPLERYEREPETGSSRE